MINDDVTAYECHWLNVNKQHFESDVLIDISDFCCRIVGCHLWMSLFDIWQTLAIWIQIWMNLNRKSTNNEQQQENERKFPYWKQSKLCSDSTLRYCVVYSKLSRCIQIIFCFFQITFAIICHSEGNFSILKTISVIRYQSKPQFLVIFFPIFTGMVTPLKEKRESIPRPRRDSMKILAESAATLNLWWILWSLGMDAFIMSDKIKPFLLYKANKLIFKQS